MRDAVQLGAAFDEALVLRLAVAFLESRDLQSAVLQALDRAGDVADRVGAVAARDIEIEQAGAEAADDRRQAGERRPDEQAHRP